MVLPVNLKIGYESTVLSHRDGALMRENRVNTEGQRYLVVSSSTATTTTTDQLWLRVLACANLREIVIACDSS